MAPSNSRPASITSRPARSLARHRPAYVPAALEAVVGGMAPDEDGIVKEMTAVIVDEVPVLNQDDELRGLLSASVAENVKTALQILAHAIDPASVDAPLSAITYARRLAQRNIPLAALLRAYRLGQERFLAYILNQAATRDTPDLADILIQLVHITSTYVDRVSEQVGVAYSAERERWAQDRDVTQRHWVNQLLTARQVDVARAEMALDYQMGVTHLATEVWTDDPPPDGEVLATFNSAAGCISRALHASGRSLVVPTDECAARIWFALGHSTGAAAQAVMTQLRRARMPVRVAMGTADSGLAGFQRSARNAARAKRLVLGTTNKAPQVVAFDQVAPVALLSDDAGDLADFVRRTLGGLATPEGKGDWLREALLAFLRNNRSYATTAKELHVHRNTVQYRVQRALAAYGRPLEGDLLSLRLALEAAYWRGSDVLGD